METSFVVSAAFWAPVATESQNDMAFLVAINVETEMVSVARVLSDFESVGTMRRPRPSLAKREVAFFHINKKRRIKRESARGDFGVHAHYYITECNSFRSF